VFEQTGVIGGWAGVGPGALLTMRSPAEVGERFTSNRGGFACCAEGAWYRSAAGEMAQR